MVLLPAIFGPVMSMICAPLVSRRTSLGTKRPVRSWRSTTGWRPSRISIREAVVNLGPGVGFALGDFGEGIQHVDAREGTGDLLDLGRPAGGTVAQGQE